MVLMSASMTFSSAAVCVSLDDPVDDGDQGAGEREEQRREQRRETKALGAKDPSSTQAACIPCRGSSGWIGIRAMIELGAQPADVALHDAGLRIEVNVPHVLEQHAARDDAIGIAHQILEQTKLLRQQLDLPAGASQRPLQQIHFQVTGAQPGHDFRRRRAACQHADPRQQFHERKRLDEVVVCAGLQPVHPVVDAAHGRQIDHRRHHVAGTQALDQTQAVEQRQHAVEHDDLMFWPQASSSPATPSAT